MVATNYPIDLDKLSSTLAFNNYGSNMALNIDNDNIVVNNVVNNIIFNNSNRNDEVRGYTLVPSTTSSHSVSCFSSNKSEELYTDQMQKESDSIVQNNPTASTDSIQLEYAI